MCTDPQAGPEHFPEIPPNKPVVGALTGAAVKNPLRSSCEVKKQLHCSAQFAALVFVNFSLSMLLISF